MNGLSYKNLGKVFLRNRFHLWYWNESHHEVDDVIAANADGVMGSLPDLWALNDAAPV